MITLATTPEQAVQATGEYRAGGTDVQARRLLGVSKGPLVDIRKIEGLRAITTSDDGAVSMGALVTLHEIATDPLIKQHYPDLAHSAAGLATPQIRHMATLGGSLLQHTRCWYYRHPDFTCYKKGEPLCPAREGRNPNGVVFDLGPCVFPHPSTVGMILLAHDAQFETHEERPRPLAALYGDGSDPFHDHTLEPNQLLTKVILPPLTPGERASYFRSIGRARAEWPIVEAYVRLNVTDDHITLARLAVGGVANIPLRFPSVEAALKGKPATQETLQRAAELAAEGSNPVPQAEYKVAFLVGTVLETLERGLELSTS